MTREELESRSKPELIDLALRQQEQIAGLRRQIAQLQLATPGDGAALASAAAATPAAGEFPRALRLVLIAGAILACAVIAIIASFRPAIPVDVGRATDYPPGSVTALHLPAPNQADPTIPIYLVNDPIAGFLALHRQSPGSGCLVAWDESAGRFVDPCHGAMFTRLGDYAEGPSPRGLDRYLVSVTEAGRVAIEVNRIQRGPSP
jgi:hypothetical protein